MRLTSDLLGPDGPLASDPSFGYLDELGNHVLRRTALYLVVFRVALTTTVSRHGPTRICPVGLLMDGVLQDVSAGAHGCC